MEALHNADAAHVAREVAEHAKLLHQAKKRIHWSEWMSGIVGLVFLALANWSVEDVQSYGTYDMHRLTPMHLLSPTMYFSLAILFFNQIYILALSRRTEALAKLVGEVSQVAKE